MVIVAFLVAVERVAGFNTERSKQTDALMQNRLEHKKDCGN
jgi:hypothetical protein